MALILASASEFIIYDIFFRSVRMTGSSICNSIHYLTTTDKAILEQDVNLRQLDLENKTEMLVEFINGTKNDSVLNKKIIASINEIIVQIRAELQQINESKLKHQQKWLSSWRTLDYSNNIKNLKLQNEILDRRINLLKSCNLHN